METTVPTDLTTVEAEALESTLADLIAEFDRMHDAGSTDIAAMTEIAEHVEAIRTEIASRETTPAEAAQAIAALAEKIRPAETEVTDEPVATEDDEDDETEEEADEVEAETEDTTHNTEVEETEAITEERELVTAAGTPTPKAPSARAVRAFSPAPEAPAAVGPEIVITAAADVPGVPTGAQIDLLTVARAMHDKARGLNDKSAYTPVARINMNFGNEVGADLAHTLDVLDRVRNPQSLVAAGGWCAPSQNYYEIFQAEAGDGLLDLPTITVTRGGINVPSFYSVSDAAEGLWSWTEADDVSAHDPTSPEGSKACLRIPCPEFTDYRLAAEGLCITNGNLTDRAFPELTQRFVQLALNAHLHRLSAAMIADIVGTATGVTMGSVNATAAGSILNAIDLQVEDYKSQYRMAVGSVLEAIFPLWTKAVIRADLALRHGVALTNVTDAMVDDHFAARKVRAQFVHDYQALFNAAEATAWPSTLDFLLYPAGGYVRGDGGTIDLGVVRDSVLNATNDYTAAWTEQLYVVAQMGPAAREVTVNIDVNSCQPMSTCDAG